MFRSTGYVDGTVQVILDDTPVGMGILVEPHLVITCAHVVNGAIGREQMDDQPFPFEKKILLVSPYSDNEGKTIQGKVIQWYGPTNKSSIFSDFAVVELSSSFRGLNPAVFVEGAIDGNPQELEAFGYTPATGRKDISMNGEVAYCRSTQFLGRGRVGLEPSSFEDRKRKFLRPGFSGAHLYAEPQKAVIGMVEFAGGIEETTAFMVPTETIMLLCPEVVIVSGRDQ